MSEKKKEKLDQILDKLSEHDRRFDEMDDKFSDKFNKVLTGLDKVTGELEKAREDRVFAKAKDDGQDLRIDNLDKRVQKIEVKIS